MNKAVLDTFIADELFAGEGGFHVRASFDRIFSLHGWNRVWRIFKFAPREIQVALLMCQGYSAPEMAAKLSIREGTVREYIKHVMRAVGVHRRERAIVKMILMAWSLSQE